MGGVWVEDYRKFITDFSGSHEFGELMFPSGTIYRSTDYPQLAPHISVAFDPMPEWIVTGCKLCFRHICFGMKLPQSTLYINRLLKQHMKLLTCPHVQGYEAQ